MLHTCTHTSQNRTWGILVWNQVSPRMLSFCPILQHSLRQPTWTISVNLNSAEWGGYQYKLTGDLHIPCQVAYHGLSSSKYNPDFFLSLQVWVLYTSYPPVLRFQNRPYPYPAASLFLSSKQHLQKTFAGALSSSGSYMFLFQADSNGLCLCFMLACILYMHDVESPASQQDLLSFELLDCCTRHRPGLDHKHDELPQTCAVLHRSEYFSYEQNKAT